jgi:hypothetical protein
MRTNGHVVDKGVSGLLHGFIESQRIIPFLVSIMQLLENLHVRQQ